MGSAAQELFLSFGQFHIWTYYRVVRSGRVADDGMSRKSSSTRWKQRQADDPWVRKAQLEGWRSRAVYKLAEIDTRDRLLRPGMTVVDLGAAPGGWSQYAAGRVLPRGRVLALDILPLEPLQGVEVIQADFAADDAPQQIRQLLGNSVPDLVLSDMAPNISGTRAVDQPRSMYLVELAFALATELLASDGGFVTKVFMGEGFEQMVRQCRQRFATVKVRKPAASRRESRETYIVASGFRL